MPPEPTPEELAVQKKRAQAANNQKKELQAVSVQQEASLKTEKVSKQPAPNEAKKIVQADKSNQESSPKSDAR